MTPALTKKKPASAHRTSRRPARAAEWNLRRAGGLKILGAPALAKLPWLLHGFSTRVGGESKLATSTVRQKSQSKILSLGFTDWDTRAHVTENRKQFFGAIGASKMRVVALRQIHSDIVHI